MRKTKNGTAVVQMTLIPEGPASKQIGVAEGKINATGDFVKRFKNHPEICEKSVVHCFTGDKATLDRYLSMGFSIGIMG